MQISPFFLISQCIVQKFKVYSPNNFQYIYLIDCCEPGPFLPKFDKLAAHTGVFCKSIFYVKPQTFEYLP
jgi:hypothetical protein